ncbi:hypothetical protein F2Q69_00058556 [Brassica cretica]|uniref:Uncharacterized protein n=1 Tax=Brassica cretica TaxID=69181 RepID=A0A8S9RE03_BRACR|nr:hypothetical protein F2Q69_00058556 [Brassica cretica]
MRGDTRAHTCRDACLRHMQGDTPTSTCSSACTTFMRCDTPASACQSACVVRRYCGTSSYDLSSCMFSTHERLHLVLVSTLSFLVARYHFLAIGVETPRASCFADYFVVKKRRASKPSSFCRAFKNVMLPKRPSDESETSSNCGRAS